MSYRNLKSGVTGYRKLLGNLFKWKLLLQRKCEETDCRDFSGGLILYMFIQSIYLLDTGT